MENITASDQSQILHSQFITWDLRVTNLACQCTSEEASLLYMHTLPSNCIHSFLCKHAVVLVYEIINYMSKLFASSRLAIEGSIIILRQWNLVMVTVPPTALT